MIDRIHSARMIERTGGKLTLAKLKSAEAEFNRWESNPRFKIQRFSCCRTVADLGNGVSVVAEKETVNYTFYRFYVLNSVSRTFTLVPETEWEKITDHAVQDVTYKARKMIAEGVC